jgi:DNA-binding transcriptional MocR family regulator
MIHEPAYVGWIHTLRSLGLNVIPIPHRANQIDFQALRQKIQQYQPVFIVPISTFSDPTGYSLPVAQKQELIIIAEDYDTLILEDDACGMLSYDQNSPPTIKSFDRNNRQVIYIGSFCKAVMPGLGIGYMISTEQHHEQLLAVRRAVDAASTVFVERAFANYLRSGRLKDHIRRVNTIYAGRRNALLQALRDFMPTGVEWTEPPGGFSCWVTLPQANMMQIYRTCLKMGLSFTPGDSFFIDSNPNRHFRLCFSTQSEGEIQEIVRLLAQVIYNHTDR